MFLLVFHLHALHCAGDGGYARDARLEAPSALAVSPNGTLYIADLGNIRIRAVSLNRPRPGAAGLYEVPSLPDQELYVFSANGTHLHTRHLITGDFLYNFTYDSAERQLSAVVAKNGQAVHVRREGGGGSGGSGGASGAPLWLAVPGGQVFWLSVSMAGGRALKRVSAQGHDVAHLSYHGGTGLLATKSNENGWTTVYE